MVPFPQRRFTESGPQSLDVHWQQAVSSHAIDKPVLDARAKRVRLVLISARHVPRCKTSSFRIDEPKRWHGGANGVAMGQRSYLFRWCE